MALPKKISGLSTEVDKAIAAIKRRYPGISVGEFKGVRSLNDAVEQYKGLVLESSLPEKFSNRALMAAATKVGTQRFVAYGAGNEDARKTRAAGKPVATKAAKKRM